jgi:hypothetical protein
MIQILEPLGELTNDDGWNAECFVRVLPEPRFSCFS